MENVETQTVMNNLCTSCGMCIGVCPEKCINFIKSEGQYFPRVEEKNCIDCGICIDICPGYSVNLHKLYLQEKKQEPDNYYIGNYEFCYTGSACNSDIRKKGVSGGCVTAIIKELLDTNKYDVAFLVDSHECGHLIETKAFRKGDSLTATAKSRYVPISHNNMIKYVLKNKEERVIIVATSCAVQGFIKVISKFGLNRENYFIVGLFCDKILSHNIFEYFNDYNKPKTTLKNLYFRTKEDGGWPGKVKLEYENGQKVYLPASERIVLKNYFQLERCMYCIDKLNQFADISIGDNYTGENISKEGSNSIIIRTSRGKNVWNLVNVVINIQQSNIEDIVRSQHIDERSQNYKFALMYEENKNIVIYPECCLHNNLDKLADYKLMIKKIEMIQAGRNYEDNRIAFHKKIKYIKSRNLILNTVKFIMRKLQVMKIEK